MKTIEEYQDDNKKKSEISFYAFFGIDNEGNTTNRAFYDLEEAKQEAKKSKRYNTIMMIISVVSMMIAAAAWLLPNILGGVS